MPSLVIISVPTCRKRGATKLTQVGSLSCVSTQMDLQVTFLKEMHFTELTIKVVKFVQVGILHVKSKPRVSGI